MGRERGPLKGPTIGGKGVVVNAVRAATEIGLVRKVIGFGKLAIILCFTHFIVVRKHLYKCKYSINKTSKGTPLNY